MPSATYRALRHLIQLRDTFVRQAVAAQVRIKAMLLLEQIPFPDSKGRWSIAARQGLERLSCSAPIRFKLDRLLSAMTFAQEQAVTAARQDVSEP